MKMTPEITEYILEAQYAPLTTPRQPDKYKAIIIGSILEQLQSLDNIFYDGKGILYLISLIHDVIFVIPKLIIGRLMKYQAIPVLEPEKVYTMSSDVNADRAESVVVSATVRQREKYNSLKDNYITDRNKKVNKAEAIIKLRKYLYANNLELKGTIVNSQITFGKDLDIMLKEVVTSDFNKDNINNLENELKNIYQESIKVVY